MVCNERSYAILHLIPCSGRGGGIVVSIGEQTEFGAIFATMQEVDPISMKVSHDLTDFSSPDR